MKIYFFLFFGLLLLPELILAQSGLHFTGDTDNGFVLGTDNASLDLTKGTIEAWIKTSNAGTDFRGIVVKKDNYGIFLRDNALSTYDWTSGTIPTSVPLNDGTWHHVAFAFDSGVTDGSKLYVDGLPVKVFTYNVNNFDDVIVAGKGRSVNDGLPFECFEGDIDQVRVWNTVRTDGEILENYQKYLSGNEDGLVMLWQFEEKEGTTVYDISGNGNNGTLYNLTEVNRVEGSLSGPLSYWSFDGNADDSKGINHGVVYGAVSVADRAGNPDSAFGFDGIDDYIQLLFPGPAGVNPRTICFWAKTSVTPDASYSNAVLSYGSNTSSYAYGDRLEIDLNSRATGLELTVGGTVINKAFDNTDGDWHFYAIAFDGGTEKTIDDFRFYADGQLLTAEAWRKDASNIINTSTANALNFGRLYDGSRYFTGAIDDVSIFGYGMDATAVNEIFTQGIITGYPELSIKEMGIVPNPVEDRINLYFSGFSGLVTYEILNLHGITIDSGVINFDEEKATISCSGLLTGIYLLKVSQDQNCSVFRFLKR